MPTNVILFTLPRPDPIVKPSLSIGYLASYLKVHGIGVECLDIEAVLGSLDDKWRWVRNWLCLEEPPVVGISVCHPDSIPMLANLVNIVKETCPAMVVVGGYGPTFWPELLFRKVPAVDAAIRGEGEIPFLNLVHGWLNHESLDDMQGVVTKDGDMLVYHPPGSLMEDMDKLPYPLRIFAPPELQGDLSDGVSIISGSRGCVANCSFCSIRQFYSLAKQSAPSTHWRARSADNIIAEMEMVVKEFGTRFFAFVDDDFIGSIKYGGESRYEFARRLLDRNTGIRFRFATRVNNVERELFTMLKKAGLACIDIGVESISARALKLYNKGITPQRIQEKIQILIDLGVKFRPTMIPFNHQTTLEELAEHLEFIRFLRRVDALILPSSFINNVIPWPGTPLRAEYKEMGILNADCFEAGTDFAPQLPSYSFSDPRVQVILEQMALYTDELIHQGVVYPRIVDLLIEFFEKLLVLASKYAA